MDINYVFRNIIVTCMYTKILNKLQNVYKNKNTAAGHSVTDNH